MCLPTQQLSPNDHVVLLNTIYFARNFCLYPLLELNTQLPSFHILEVKL